MHAAGEQATQPGIAASPMVPRVSRLAGLAGAQRMIANPALHLAALSRRFGDCFTYPFGGLATTLVVSRPSIIRHVLKLDAENFGKSDIQTRFMFDFLGPGLLTYHGDVWRRQRRVIAGGFTPDQLLRQTALIGEQATTAVATLAEGEVDISAAMRRLTFGMVTRSMLGRQVTDAQVAQISDAIRRVQSFVVTQIVVPWAAPLFHLTGSRARHQALRRRGDAIVAGIVAERIGGRAEPGVPADMLDMLVGSAAPAEDPATLVPAVTAEVMQLLVAGHETSANVLAWALWLLARHPEWLAAVRGELEQTLGGRAPTPADLPRLALSMATLKETMRLYPPFWLVDRVALHACSIDGVAIPAGMRIALFVFGAHRRADCWPEPERFDPSRFLDRDRAAPRHPAYTPFGDGQRVCVGSAYANLQMMVVLAALLPHFDLQPIDDDITPKGLLVMGPDRPIRLALRRRI